MCLKNYLEKNVTKWFKKEDGEKCCQTGRCLKELPDSEGSCVAGRDEGRIECYWNTAVAKLCQKLFRKLMTTDHHAIEDP